MHASRMHTGALLVKSATAPAAPPVESAPAGMLSCRRFSLQGGIVAIIHVPGGDGRTSARVCAAALAAVLAAVPAVPAAQDSEAEYATEMRAGDTALARRQFEPALKAFKRANALKNKKSLEALHGMARAFHGLGAFKNAVEACDDALKLAGEDLTAQARIRNQRGLSLFSWATKSDDKRLKDAEADFRAVLTLDPSQTVARYNLGVVLMKQARDDEGRVELEAYLADAGKTPESEAARRFIDNPRRAREPFAPDFSVTTRDGEYLSLDELKGKVVLLDFWATWCPPCVAATPGLVRLHNKYKDRPFALIGVSLDRDQRAWADYIDEHQMAWPQYLDKGQVARAFAVQPIPTYILIDHEGVIRGTRTGYSSTTDAWLDGEVRKLLKAVEESAGARR